MSPTGKIHTAVESILYSKPGITCPKSTLKTLEKCETCSELITKTPAIILYYLPVAIAKICVQLMLLVPWLRSSWWLPKD